ncbi:DUF397 domain-containing protein [Allokutzneria oryzae]|uniref:DUF397 domain-containing protein n=1 Tax=Allokutzneria oryzae TaxID=1378989 RepID=A0ABV5ZPR6_9PSEU
MKKRDTGWFKSTYSGGAGNECVECRLTESRAYLRDSKNPNGAVLHTPIEKWNGFLHAVVGEEIR